MAYTDIDKPSDYFNTVLWTGNGNNNRTITGVNFQPDLIWTKSRSSGYSHQWYDSVRSFTNENVLFSDSTSAEQGADPKLYGYCSGVTSDGFTLTNGTAGNPDIWTNDSGGNYVSWNWKAETSFSNSAGANGATIASTGSVNQDAGFSIISYTGNGSAGATVAHGLGVKPSWFIVKRLNAAEEWDVYHQSLGATKNMSLNNSAAPNTSASRWNNTEPTSSVFSLGNIESTNYSGNNYIAYLFAEKKGYSKFGSYTGNGSTDGTFVYTGFKPAWVLVKIISGGDNWTMADNKRNGFNADNDVLYPNLANAEVNTNWVDLLSNGFKMRRSDGAENGSGGNYIFMAFAEESFVSSSGVPATAR